ncbi:C2H2 type zinc-finger-domain-containing protein [Gymnopilus junonius]|uniref:C2H2 type zinc-finger-domain-containing protein n=1 Tax=Gymnopilus junonius TaxID=109634 RepID=A0A9P5NLV2_GYMJU|nr:C2H2 type zinc-finger-domain-containing protein [Gymnopilus junonius]
MADSDSPLFTCLSCSIAFLSPEDQRVHYRSDHHRYNMKRRVASLPPISVEVFNQKVLERRTETAVMSSTKGSSCEVCNKTYTTENAYRTHIQSKKHKENEVKAALKPARQTSDPEQDGNDSVPEKEIPVPTAAPTAQKEEDLLAEKTPDNVAEGEEGSDDEVVKTIEEKIAAARLRLSDKHCLFCSHVSSSLDNNLTHMSTAHSFFIPDAEYLIDIPGLITYLGEKIAVGNVCIYCNEKGREFRSMDAVRRHMVDKSHCKIAYDKERDRLELSDYYDFSSSYPDAEDKKSSAEEGDEEWEDADDVSNDEVDEIVDESASDATSDSSSETEDDDEQLPDNQLTYGDTPYELVLPSGARIGHRTMRRYYAQSFPGAPRGGKAEDPNSGALWFDALVPRKGGFGAYGSGTEVVKARNRGEAREAGRHVREFRDQKRREDFKTKVAFIHNSQKHFRDPCYYEIHIKC